MNTKAIVRRVCPCVAACLLVVIPRLAWAQSDAHGAETAQIMKADADFAQSVAQRNREQFLSFIADVTTLNGGSASELHGRDAVMKEWADFFDPNGPTLSWTPSRGEVVGAGDLGYTTGRSLLRVKEATGVVTERRGHIPLLVV